MPTVGAYLNEFVPGLTAADPWPTYRELLAAPPLASADGSLVVVSRVADCVEVLRNPVCSNERGKASLTQMPGLGGASFIVMDPPDHTRLRALVTKAFTRRAIDRIEDWFRREVHRRLDQLVGSQRIEVVSQIARPLPLLAISEMLGIPEDDREQVGRWAELAARNLDEALQTPRTSEEGRRWRHALLAWRKYITDLAEQRRAAPRDDLLSALVLAEQQGDRLTNHEVVRTVQLVFGAGHETTLSAIGTGAKLLAERSDLARRVALDDDFAAGFAEEVIRAFPPSQYITRTAAEDLVVGGVPVVAGATIIVLLGAANLDPERYDAPEEFRPTRDDQRHLSFGSGIHHCVGAPLARMETRVAMQILARRLDNPRVSSDGTTTWNDGLQLRGYGVLNLDVDRILPAGETVYGDPADASVVEADAVNEKTSSRPAPDAG
jgi:cytochrome P450